MHYWLFWFVNVLFFVAFLYFAYLNLDDADAWLWVPIYLSAAVCCGFAILGYIWPRVYLGLVAGYLVYATILFFSPDGVRDWIFKYKRPSIVESMKAEKPWIEKTREFFGLLIITAALLMDYFWRG